MSEIIYQGLENVLRKGITNYQFTKNKEDLFSYSSFYEDTESFLLKEVECAEFFLKKIKSGNMRLNDINPLYTLLKLYSKIREPYSNYRNIKSIFVKTLEYVEHNIEIVMNEELCRPEDYYEQWGEYYGYGPYCLLVNAVAVIRSRALAEYVKNLAKHLKSFPDITDLHGGNYLIVSNVKLEGVEEWFGDIKTDHSEYAMATFSPLSDGKWRFQFNNLGPVNNFIFMQAAYINVADILSAALDADVELCTWLDD